MGVKFLAAQGGVTSLSSEMEQVSELFDTQATLREVFSDPSIEATAKQGILRDLLGGVISAYSLRILFEATELEEPGRLAEAIAQLPGLLTHPIEEATGALTTTARVRAFTRALYSSIEDRGRLGEIEHKLYEFADVVATNSRLRRALSGIGTVADQRIGIIDDLVGADSDKVFVESLRFAASAGRIRDFVEVTGLMAEIAATLRRTRVAEVHVARPLSEEDASRIGAALAAASGLAVEIHQVIDESVIGGVLAVVGDTVYDGSVRHRLDQLRSRLGMATLAR
ncbi:MAG: ATP synthase F1 subunit delta [Actinomycetota bacterium]|nr:ATP synthase F1 subunit delta [Actinomycetota bacterium]